MKILVTGGAGFIGSHIVEELVKQGNEVTVIDNLSTGNLDNIKPFLDKIKFIEGDIKNLDLLKKEFKDIDYIFHEAALVSVTKSIENPLESHNNTAFGTLNVLIAAKECNVKRVIYASSAAVYGDTEELPLKENSKINPLSPFFSIRNLSFKYFNYNETPFNEPDFLLQQVLGVGDDIMLGYGKGRRLHVYLVEGFNNPGVVLLDPAEGKEHEENFDDIVRKMFEKKIGGFGLVKKL
jgi:hypothetical protein